MLDLDLPRLVGLLEDGVRGVGREAVARVRRHHLADHPAPEEQRAERAEAGHDEGQPGVVPPVLAGHLPGAGRPPAVAQHDVDGVTRTDVALDGLVEGEPDLGHGAVARGRRTGRPPRGTDVLMEGQVTEPPPGAMVGQSTSTSTGAPSASRSTLSLSSA